MSKATYLVEVTINVKLKMRAKNNRDAREHATEIAEASVRAFEDRGDLVAETHAITVEAK